MHCDHKRVYEMEVLIKPEEASVLSLLQDGWEPFTVIPETEHSYLTYYFKRLTPCQSCAQEISDAEERVKVANSACVMTDGKHYVYTSHRWDVDNEHCLKCGLSMYAKDVEVKEYPLPKDFKDLAP